MVKKNSNILRITVIVLGVASLAGGIVYSYGVLNSDVEDNAEAIEEQKDENKEMSDMNIRQDNDIIEIKGDMRYMKEDIGEIKDGMQQQTTILHEVLREVRK